MDERVGSRRSQAYSPAARRSSATAAAIRWRWDGLFWEPGRSNPRPSQREIVTMTSQQRYASLRTMPAQVPKKGARPGTWLSTSHTHRPASSYTAEINQAPGDHGTRAISVISSPSLDYRRCPHRPHPTTLPPPPPTTHHATPPTGNLKPKPRIPLLSRRRSSRARQSLVGPGSPCP